MAKPCAHSALSPNLTRHLQPVGKGILVKSLVPRPDHQPCMSKCPLTSLSGCPIALPPQGSSAQAKLLIFPRPSQLPQPPSYRPAILAFCFLSKPQSIQQILLVVPSKHTQNPTTAHLLHCYLCGLHHHPRSSVFFLLICIFFATASYGISCVHPGPPYSLFSNSSQIHPRPVSFYHFCSKLSHVSQSLIYIQWPTWPSDLIYSYLLTNSGSGLFPATNLRPQWC